MAYSDDYHRDGQGSTGITTARSHASGESGLPLRDLLQVLRRRIWLITGLVLVTTVAAAVYASTQPPLFKARATIRLRNDRQALTGGLATDPSAIIEGTRTDPIISRIQVLKSRAVLGQVVEQEGLRLSLLSGSTEGSNLRVISVGSALAADTITISFMPSTYAVAVRDSVASVQYGDTASVVGLTVTAMRPAQLGTTRFAVLGQDAAINHLATTISALPRERTDVVDITYTDEDPLVAQRVVNSLARTFQTASVADAQQMSRRRREFLQGQLTAAESTLKVAQNQLSEFRRNTEAFSASSRYSAQQTGLTTIEMSRAQLQADRSTYGALLSRLEQLHAQRDVSNTRAGLMTLVASPGIAENPVVQQLYQRLVGYETSRDSITTGQWAGGGGTPAVTRLDTLITTTRAQLVGAVRSHVSVLDARITSLTELRDRTAAALATLPSIQAQEDRLLYEVQSIRDLASELRSEYQKARIAEAVTAGDVEIVDLAAVPVNPINSRRILIVLLGLATGLFAGSALALLLDKANSTLRHGEDILAKLHLRTLAIIPATAGAGAVQGFFARMKQTALPQGSRGNGRAPVPARTALAVASRNVDAFSEMNSATAEAYRTLRTNLLFSQVQRQVKTVVITSTAAGEGKTTTASNLGVALARQGLKVLVVDCDMRRPRLHEAFNVTREPGFTQLLLGVVPQSTAIRPTTVENLSVLPCGAIPPNPSEILSAPKTRELLSSLEAGFDTVILDTPPMLASADAAVLAARVDGVLIVVRAGSTDAGAARQAIDQLRFVGANILGAVLNDPDSNLPGYGKYHYYYSDYATAEA